MQAVHDFLQWGNEVKGWSANTIDSYKSHLTNLVTFLTGRLGHEPQPADITVDAIERHDVVRKREGKAQRSRSAMQACYISFVRYLRRRGLIETEQAQAVANMDRVRVTEKPKRRYATPEQVGLMFEAAGYVHRRHRKLLQYREPLAYAVLSVLAYTGARVSEVCTVAVSDVDLSAASPTITFRHAKGNKSRTLPLHPLAAKHICAWLKARPFEHPILFACPTYRLGEAPDVQPMSEVKVRGILAELARLAGITDDAVLKPHAFRRFAAAAIASVPGATLKHVQEFLGHSSLIISERYLGGMNSDLSSLVGQMQVPAEKPAIPDSDPRVQATRRRKAAFRRAMR